MNQFVIIGDTTMMWTAKGHKFLIDTEDFEKVWQCRWHGKNTKTTPYISTSVYRKHRSAEHMTLHRLILNTPTSPIDHINQDKSDNRKSNLRIATMQQNAYNRAKYKGATIYKGVTNAYHNRSGKHSYRARIRHNGRSISLGLFNTAEDAARRYNEEAIKLFGEFA